MIKQTQAMTRRFLDGHWTPPLQNPIPTVGGEFGTVINEIAINAGSYVAVPTRVKQGQALSWSSISPELNGQWGPFAVALSHTEDVADAFYFATLGSANEPGLRFKDAQAGGDVVDPKQRVPADIDTSKPLFTLIWAIDQTKAHKIAYAFTNGNSPAHGGTPS